MKSFRFKKALLSALISALFIFSANSVFAQDPPPPPPAVKTTISYPQGKSAPVFAVTKKLFENGQLTNEARLIFKELHNFRSIEQIVPPTEANPYRFQVLTLTIKDLLPDTDEDPEEQISDIINEIFGVEYDTEGQTRNTVSFEIVEYGVHTDMKIDLLGDNTGAWVVDMMEELTDIDPRLEVTRPANGYKSVTICFKGGTVVWNKLHSRVIRVVEMAVKKSGDQFRYDKLIPVTPVNPLLRSK